MCRFRFVPNIIPHDYHFMMNIIAWNVRGAGKDRCASTIKDLKKAYAIDVFAILEPRISGSRALSVAQSLGFSHYHIVLGVFGCCGMGIQFLFKLFRTLAIVYANPCPGI